MGLEPTTLGTTTRCSNRLSYIHHVLQLFQLRCKYTILFYFGTGLALFEEKIFPSTNKTTEIQHQKSFKKMKKIAQ